LYGELHSVRLYKEQFYWSSCTINPSTRNTVRTVLDGLRIVTLTFCILERCWLVRCIVHATVELMISWWLLLNVCQDRENSSPGGVVRRSVGPCPAGLALVRQILITFWQQLPSRADIRRSSRDRANINPSYMMTARPGLARLSDLPQLRDSSVKRRTSKL